MECRNAAFWGNHHPPEKRRLRKMKSFKWMAALLVGAGLVAKANLIDPSSHVGADRPANSNPNTEVALIEATLGLSDLIFLAKVDAQDPDEDPLGLLAGGFITVTDLVGDDDDSANVSWDLTGTGYEMLAVFVKGGQGDTRYRVSLDQLLASDSPQAATVLL